MSRRPDPQALGPHVLISTGQRDAALSEGFCNWFVVGYMG